MIRERIEASEELVLSKYAALAKNSAGRMKEEKQCNLRTVFQVDRGKILHSRAFRRLKQKTQMVFSPKDDHYRTRLTHTLEVSQIARNISRALQLNEDLTEAIALGHDLGHTPFGHAGEDALNKIMPEGFRHNEQSLRVVDLLEKCCSGLNLTEETRDGILNHTEKKLPLTLEGQVVRLSDRIAYINHDIEDAVSAGILKLSDIPKWILEVLEAEDKFKIDVIMNSVVENSQDGSIRMSGEVKKAFDSLRSFMYENVYLNFSWKKESEKVPMFIEVLFDYLLKNPQVFPEEIKMLQEAYPIERVVCDYIASMTDPFAVSFFEEVFVPKSWTV